MLLFGVLSAAAQTSAVYITGDIRPEGSGGIGIRNDVSTIPAINGRTIYSPSAAEIYDVAGRRIAAINNSSVTLPSAGLYIVKLNGKATRIAVR